MAKRDDGQFGDPARQAPGPDLVLVHSSDVHVDDDYAAALFGGDGAGHLRRVIRAAEAVCADLLLLVGDTFDHNRLPSRVIERAAAIMAEFGKPIVILPGNHDPATPDSPFMHPAMGDLAHVHVLGVRCGEVVRFSDLRLEIWGRPHRDFQDMSPLEALPPPSEPRRIVLAHGHYEPTPDYDRRPRPSWLFGDDQIAASGASYLALGHWNRAVAVGGGSVPAWYSGSPDYAQTVNVVRLDSEGRASVRRETLD